MLNSQYDSIILQKGVLLPCAPPDCNIEETAIFESYKEDFNHQVEPVLSSPSKNGYFIDSCYIHCQTYEDDVAWTQISINGVTIAQSFGDWYFGRSANTRLKDCDDGFPCNPTCPTPESGDTKSSTTPYLLALALYLMITFALLWNSYRKH